MSRGRRYDQDRKLNYKKVFGVLIGILVVAMMILTIINLVGRESAVRTREELSFFASFYNGKWGVINSLRRRGYFKYL